ncbi:MAG: tetratricopeptide repeat protein [Gammaproteobacteria bacterium]|nr:MAG: tetratricopeptide repeat protein [Gammaproteobacteria bacterium]
MKKIAWLARTSPLICTSFLLAGCHMFGGDNHQGKTLADLPSAVMPDAKNTVAIVDNNKIETSYQKALASAEDPVLRQQIMARIADFEMARSEQQQLNANDSGHYFDKPIVLYRELIALQEKSGQPVKGVELDQLRYKLAKALSMDSRGDEAASALDQLAKTAPASTYMGETQFRRAEKAFADGDYLAAEKHYQSVAEDKNNPLQQNALYMQGWAEFKRADYDSALQSFAKVTDQLLVSAKKPDQLAGAVERLSGAQKNMMEDTFHVMSLSFSYLEGAQSIIDLQKEMGDRVYEHLLYENLGQLYLDKKRFSDSAETYKSFVEHNPLSDYAPEFSIKMISVYEQGNFPSLILPAKQEYIQRYGISSTYWTQRNGLVGVNALNYLHKSLQELAEFEHAQAQELAVTNKTESRASFSRAANWYREFVATFPKDPKNSEMTFLLAESLSESGDYPQAINAYEQVAYQYQDKEHGADAGYSIVLLANELATGQLLAETQKAAWQERKTNYALKFAQGYPADPRAAAVLTQAAQELLNQKRFAEAATVAEEIINLKPPAEPKLQFTAWLVLGHSNFDDKNYAGAEKAYWQVLTLLPANAQTPGAPTAQQMRDRIAASIYQQAQSDLSLGQKDQAIAKLLRISDVAPDSDIAIKGRYDAGVYLIEQQKWSEAEQVYLSFRQQYPKHELTASIPAKLVLIYQNQSKWALAASELSIMERSSNDPNVKRQSLAMGAELYEKSGNKTLAIEQYQRYANEYPRPVAEAMEAELHLAQLYGELKDNSKRQYWLQRMIDANASAGAQANDRTKYLAASAANEIADAPYKEFASTPLTLPLKQSLKVKRAALDKALKAQEVVLAYGVAEFTTQASYRIGDIYAQLSRDLMKSERPKDLDALALEQYDLLLEEQATPFEEKAIQIHQANAQRTTKGIYDQWVKQSFEALATLLPARYKKSESVSEVSNEIQ